MKVKLLTSMSGLDGAFAHGEVVTLPSSIAERLIEKGSAEKITVKKAATKKAAKRETR